MSITINKKTSTSSTTTLCNHCELICYVIVVDKKVSTISSWYLPLFMSFFTFLFALAEKERWFIFAMEERKIQSSIPGRRAIDGEGVRT